MKDLSLFNKLIFFFNNVVALLFLASFALPHVSPKTFPVIAILSLAAPILMVLLLFFLIYWIVVGFKKQMFLSIFCIVLAIIFSTFPYKFSRTVKSSNNEISLMSYNVRLFNIYSWIKDDQIKNKIKNFVKQNDPDILVLQEFNPDAQVEFDFPYRHIVLKGEKGNFGQAIYSKFKIVDKGSLNFENSDNNCIYIDILNGRDTLRVYNIHLQSLRLGNNQAVLTKESSDKIFKRFSKAFIKQQEQIEVFLEHKNQSRHKNIVCGDFNNTSYSYIYQQAIDGMKDSYLEAGEGFGKTFELRRYPLRIDFILADESLEINEHINFEDRYSDHYPIMARIGL